MQKEWIALNLMKIEFISSLLNQPPNKTFLITNNKVISYNEFLELVSKTISFLEKNPIFT